MTMIEKENLFCAYNYHPLPVILTKGEGVWLWDETGKKYLDMMSAYSAVSHGHSHPRMVKAHYMHALTCRELGDRAAALQAVARVLDLEPDHHKANFLAGVLHRDALRYADAYRSFERAVATAPDAQSAAQARSWLDSLGARR